MSFSSKMLICLMATFLFVSILICTIWYVSSKKAANIYLQAISHSYMKDTEIGFSNIFNDTTHLVTQICLNEESIIRPIINIDEKKLLPEGNTVYDYLQNVRLIHDYLSSLNGYQSYIAGIGVYSKAGYSYQTSSLIHDNKELIKIINSLSAEAVGNSMILIKPLPLESAWSKLDSKFVIPAVRAIKDQNQNNIGYVVLFFDSSVIEKIFTENLPEKSKFQVVDTLGNIIFSNCGNNILLRNDSDYKYKFYSFKIKSINWSIFMALDTNYIMSDINNALQFSTMIMLSVFILFFFIAIFISSQINRRVDELCKSINKVGAGDFSIHAPKHNDEFGNIQSNVNMMILKIKDLMNNIAEKEKQKYFSEIAYLQAQINPHFIANTLNTVSWMAKVQHADSIIPLVNSLNTLLRSAMKKSDDLITIKDELELTRSYMDIILFSGNYDFDVEWKIEPQTENLYVLRFILLPLVENAIYHGFVHNLVSNNKLKILVYVENNHLIVIVEDNGKGMTPLEIKKILTEKQEDNKSFNGIGVSNICKRINMFFGSEFSLNYESELDAFTKAVIVLPIIKDLVTREYVNGKN